MKTVVLLTSQFPFEKGESFVAPELPFAQKNGLKLHIVAVNAQNGGELFHPVAEGIKCEPLFCNGFSFLSKLGFTAGCFLKKRFWQEVRFLSKKGTLSLANIRNLIAFVSRGERIARALKKKFCSELKKAPESIVFYSYWMVDFSYAAAVLSKKYGVTAVTRAHGGDLYSHRHKGGYAPMRDFLLKNLSGIYPVSRDGELYLKENFGPRSNVCFKRLGSFNHTGPTEARNDEPVFLAVTCAYVIPLKRLPLVADALSQITHRRIHWVHFGDGPDSNALLERARTLPENICFDFRGNTKHGDIMDFYAHNKVHLFINASTSEGLPVSIMEAASFGIPVIATDVGGTHEIVSEGKNGFLLPAELDASDLANCVRRVMDMEHEEYQKMRQNARSVWESEFDADRNYDDFYRCI